MRGGQLHRVLEERLGRSVVELGDLQGAPQCLHRTLAFRRGAVNLQDDGPGDVAFLGVGLGIVVSRGGRGLG